MKLPKFTEDQMKVYSLRLLYPQLIVGYSNFWKEYHKAAETPRERKIRERNEDMKDFLKSMYEFQKNKERKDDK